MYGKIIVEIKQRENLTYQEMIDGLFDYYPGNAPTYQTVQNWVSERNHPDLVSLAIIEHNSPKGSWQKELAGRVMEASFNSQIRERLIKEGAIQSKGEKSNE